MKLIHILTLLLIFSSSFGQEDLKMLRPKKMKKDLNVLLETLEAHPDPYTKIKQDSFDLIVEEIKTNISKEMDELDFHKNISRLIASIGDGHSKMLLPKNWAEKKRKKNGVLPFEVYLTDNLELYIIKSYDTSQIEKGPQILEINGMTIPEFIANIDPYISYETTSFRNCLITRSFEKFLYLNFKTIKNLNFKLKSLTEETKIINPIEYKLWKKQKKDDKEIREKSIAKGKPYSFNIIAPGVAKIDIFSFAADLKKYNFFLNKTFNNIKSENIHSLIIDVRGNYGGWPKIASELFHYIHNGHFKTMAKSTMKISYPYRTFFTDRYPKLRNARISTINRRHYLDIEKILRGDYDTFVDEDAFFNEAPQTETNEFYGDTYLLIDRRSYSAASSFASTFQCYNMGMIIGEPTGGTKIFRANAFYKTLPNSRNRLMLSTTKLYTACFNEENQPITPDIEVIPTINERIHKIDSQLNMALMIIKKIQKRKNKQN